MARTRSIESAKRNEQIHKFRNRGWKLQRIAERYELTEARVSQILNDPNSTIPTARPKKRGRPVGSKNRTMVA